MSRTVLYLVEKYDEYYPDMQPPLDKNVAVAGAILHDIGKLREYEAKPEGAVYTAEGALIGHMLQGRDIVRDAAVESQTAAGNDAAVGTRDYSHQGRPEWGRTPKYR